MKIRNSFSITYANVLIALLLFVTSGYTQDSTNFRNLSEIKINNHLLVTILEVHNSELKHIESEIKQGSDNEIIKLKLSKVLQKYDLDLDCLKEADLSNLKLINTDLRYFNLKEANFKGSSLENVNLKYVNIKEANLESTNFTNANLESANLKEANVENAIFVNANLQSANMHEATGLTIEQLLLSKSLYKTVLPEKLELKVKKINSALLKSP